MFTARSRYDRKRILDEAERARSKGRSHKAIALYGRVLAAEPRNVELHWRVGPLLAKTGQSFDAWRSFDQVASAHLEAGRHDRALIVYREAARHLPREFEAWTSLARLETRLGDKKRARESLLLGRRQMKGRASRAKAIALLRAARDLDPWHTETVLDLSGLLGASRQTEEARWLLEQLAERVSGSELARVRAKQWIVEPSPRHAWYWLRDGLRARRAGIAVEARRLLASERARVSRCRSSEPS